MKSIISTYYYKGQKVKPVFNNIPKEKKITIIALSTKGETPFIFEKVINSQTDIQVEVKFVPTTHSEIKKKIENLK